MTSFQQNITTTKYILIHTHGKPWDQLNTPYIARIFKLTPPSI